MTVNSSYIIFALSLTVTLLGIIINLAFLASRELTRTRSGMRKLREDHDRDVLQLKRDITNIGEKLRQTESKLWYYVFATCPENQRQEVLNAMVRRLS